MIYGLPKTFVTNIFIEPFKLSVVLFSSSISFNFKEQFHLVNRPLLLHSVNVYKIIILINETH